MIILLVISYFSSLPVDVYDTYLYHLVAVKWANTFPAVHGLANFFWCMGTNSSFFLFASMIDNWFLKDRSAHIALSLLTSVLSIEFLWIAFKSKEKTLKWFAAFVLPFIAINVMHKTTVASLSTDLALGIFALAISVELIKGKAESLAIAFLLSLTMLTIKLSGIVFAGLIILFVFIKLIKADRKSRLKAILFAAVSGIAVIVPYIIRNIILSGWPLFPLPSLGLKVSWAMPVLAVKHSYEVLRAFSIWSGPEWTKYIDMSFWQWFPDWFLRNMQNPTLKIFIAALIIFAAALLVGLFSKKKFVESKYLFILGLGSLLNTLYILAESPDLRYAEVFVWILFASSLTIISIKILDRMPKLKPFFILLTVIFPALLIWPVRNGGAPLLKSMRWVPQPVTEEVLINPVDGSPSFIVKKPLGSSDQCGNADLPCTPWPSNNFKEIVAGDISKGFAPANK
jgi:hypothetical protein